METQNILLDKCKKASKATTDMALADALGVGRAAVSKYRKGLSHPDAVVCSRIAELSGEPLARVLGIVGEERAISREEKQVWRRLATAAAICFVALLAAPIGAQAATLTDAPDRHYAKLRQWLRALIATRVRLKFVQRASFHPWSVRHDRAPALLAV